MKDMIKNQEDLVLLNNSKKEKVEVTRRHKTEFLDIKNSKSLEAFKNRTEENENYVKLFQITVQKNKMVENEDVSEIVDKMNT